MIGLILKSSVVADCEKQADLNVIAISYQVMFLCMQILGLAEDV